MNLPRATPAYDATDQERMRVDVTDADRENRKRGQDVEIAGSERLILKDTVTGTRYSLTIASGAVALVAV